MLHQTSVHETETGLDFSSRWEFNIGNEVLTNSLESYGAISLDIWFQGLTTTAAIAFAVTAAATAMAHIHEAENYT